jgi:hypothetical protein
MHCELLGLRREAMGGGLPAMECPTDVMVMESSSRCEGDGVYSIG